MNFPRPYTVEEIAAIVGATIVGNPKQELTGTNEIHRIASNEIVFVDHPKYYDKAIHSAASAILINKEVEVPEGKALLVVEEPFTAFNTINAHFQPFVASKMMIAENTELGEGTTLQPNVFIGNNVKIGKGCLIHSNVTIYDNVEIGNNVIIHSGTVIGSDGFYYKNRGETFEKLLSVGSVVIADNVEIGANCTIDKGVTSPSKIGAHTKLDNLIQVGHDTIIGEHCLIAAQVGIAGCCTIGNNVKLWGQVGIKADIIIEDNVEVFAQSGVIDNLKKDHQYFGSPAGEAKEMFRNLLKIRKL